MVEKFANRMSTNKKKPVRGGNSQSKRHTGARGYFSNGIASTSNDWRKDTAKANSNETNNYGYNHRLASAFYMLIGLPVEIQKVDGTIYEGILETVSNMLEFHLIHVLKQNEKVSEDTKGNVIMFPFSDIVYCKASDADLDFAKRDSLLIDSAISASNGPLNTERELIEWQPDEDSHNLTTEIEHFDMNGHWGFHDMLRVNQEKHGVKSTFDDTMSNYMTPIEPRDTEEYKEMERRAERLAGEMEKDLRHKEHEALDSGIGEEERFSAVSRNATHSPNNNGSNINNNTDGFTPYAHKGHRGGRGNKRMNPPVAPRFQPTKSQDLTHNLNQFGNHNSAPQRAHNGSTSRSMPQSHSHTHVFHPPNRTNVPANTNQQQQQQPHLLNTQEPNNHPPTKQIMSYSAVTMKKQVNRPVQKAVMPTPQPLMQQQVAPPGQGIANSALSENNSIPKPVVLAYPPGTPTQEDLAAAKAQVIQNSKAQSNLSHQMSSQNQPQLQVTSQFTNPSVSHTTTYSDHVTQQHSTTRMSHVSEIPSSDRSCVMDKKMVSSTVPHEQSKTISKYGKINKIPSAPTEEEKPNVDDLKKFSKQFNLSDSKSRSTGPVKKHSVKSHDSALKQKPDSVLPENVLKSAVQVTTTAVPTSAATVSSSTTLAQRTTTISSSTASVAVSNVESTPTLTTSFKLNPNAKEFSFNPSAKEFTPTMNKPSVNKEVASNPAQEYAVAQGTRPSFQHVPQLPRQYYSVQTNPVMANQTDVMQHQQQVQPMVNKMSYRYPPATIYSIPTGEYTNHGGAPQVIAPQHGFMNSNQTHFVILPNTGVYPPVVPPNQPYVQMQHGQSFIRYVAATHPGNSVQQSSTRLPTNYQDGIQNFVIVSQPGTVLPHQPVVSNQHHNFSASPSPSQSPHLPQYVHSNYPQITSPITHTQGVNSLPFPPQNNAQHHQQQSFVMMHPQHPGVPLQPNQQYVQGQTHAGILSNYSAGN